MLLEIALLLVNLALFITVTMLWVEVKAMKNSTHQISYINPTTGEFEALNDATKEKLTKEPFDNVM